jgi:hypothetical protein
MAPLIGVGGVFAATSFRRRLGTCRHMPSDELTAAHVGEQRCQPRPTAAYRRKSPHP